MSLFLVVKRLKQRFILKMSYILFILGSALVPINAEEIIFQNMLVTQVPTPSPNDTKSNTSKKLHIRDNDIFILFVIVITFFTGIFLCSFYNTQTVAQIKPVNQTSDEESVQPGDQK